MVGQIQRCSLGATVVRALLVPALVTLSASGTGGCPSGTHNLIRDRDARYPAALDTPLADEGIETVKTGVRMPRLNSIMERRIRTSTCTIMADKLVSSLVGGPRPE
jgi:hypothetical protein